MTHPCKKFVCVEDSRACAACGYLEYHHNRCTWINVNNKRCPQEKMVDGDFCKYHLLNMIPRF